MRLCVFQGTFNPIHNAHLAMANYAKNNFDYNTILFVPAYKPPHKDIDDDLANHRFHMVKLAVSGESFFGISNIEFQNERFSYTFLTVQELYKRYKIDGKIGFIIGTDAFYEITTWYESEQLKNLVEFIVFPRENELDRDRLALLRHMGYRYAIAKMPPVAISSTELRKKISKGSSIVGSVPNVVGRYIRDNGLYKGEEDEE